MAPYRDNYESIKGLPTIHAATDWQSPETGQAYILVLHEAIWMSDTLYHTLVNPKQLRHYGTRFRDNPMSKIPLSIITEDVEFITELSMEESFVFVNTQTHCDNHLR